MKRNKYSKILLVLYLLPIFMLLFCIPVFAAGEDMFELADTIIRDVYNNIAAISTVLAALMSAIAVIGAKMSNTQQKADAAFDWLKRIWIAWAVINGIGAFLEYIRPLFDGYNTLP